MKVAEARISIKLLQEELANAGIGVEILAKKLRKKKEYVMDVLNSVKALTYSDLEKISELLKRPTAYFYQEILKLDPIMVKYRKGLVHKTDDLNKILISIRKAETLQKVIIDLSNGIETRQIPSFVGDKTVVLRVEELVTHLKIGHAPYLKVRDANAYFNLLRESIENIGIYVIQMQLKGSGVRGFTVLDNHYPVIVINQNDVVTGRIFSLLHEICHLLMRTDSVCLASQQNTEVEAYCNKFAANFLVPQNALREEVVNHHKPSMNWELSDVNEIAKKFKVSRESLVYRLKEFEYISKDKASRFVAEIKAIEAIAKKNKKKIIIPQEILAISRNGKAFSSLVVSNWQGENLTLSSAAQILGIKAKYVIGIGDKFGREAYGNN